MADVSLTLAVVPGRFAVCRLDPGDPIPSWATASDRWSITRTPDELSIVCADDIVADGIVAERDWRGLQVAGPLDFSLTGILAALAEPLAQAGISIFALSTYDTDYVLVKEHALAAALTALRSAGHQIRP